MQLSRAGEYAIRAMLHLAANNSTNLPNISSIAKTWNIPESFLRKILNTLTRQGLVYSSRGSGGGITLARPAQDITLLDVIEAIEGKIYLNQCLIGPEMCEHDVWCPVHTVWIEAEDTLKKILSSKSLADLVSTPEFKKHYPKVQNDK